MRRDLGVITEHEQAIQGLCGTEAFVTRDWLLEHVKSFRDDRQKRHLIIVGEPGSGKSAFVASVAQLWNCPRHFIRVDNVGGVTGVDPRAFLVSLGAQLYQKYGSAIFEEGSNGTTRVSVGWAKDQARVVGRFVDELYTLPFLAPQRRDIDVRVGVAGGASRVSGEHVRRLVDVTLALDEATLLHAVVLDPIRKLSDLAPDERVVIVIDALDEALQHPGTQILDVIPLANDAAFPSNMRLLMTSRRGEHLVRFRPQDLLHLDDEEKGYQQESHNDVTGYVSKRLSQPPLSELVTDWTREKFTAYVARMADYSRGNFLYLYHFMNAVAQDARSGAALESATPPKSLDEVYRVFAMQKIRKNIGDSISFSLSVEIQPELLAVWKQSDHIRQLQVRDRQVHIVADDAGTALETLFPAALAAGVSIYGVEIMQGTQARVWEERYLPLLGILAVALEGLTREELASFAGVEVVYVDEVILHLEQFLRVVSDDKINYYQLYHVSFSEYLLDSSRNRDYPLEARLYHDRIIAYYLVDDADSTTIRRTPNTYASRHLTAHLYQADRQATLWSLVDSPQWYDRQVEADASGAVYLSDVAWAKVAAEQADELAISRGEPAYRLGKEIRYALVTATVHSLAKNFPAKLLVGLTEAGLLTNPQAITAARLNPSPRARSETLQALAARLPAEEQLSILREALQAVYTAGAEAGNEWIRIEAMEALVPHLPEPLLEDALGVARTLRKDQYPAETLALIAAQLPEDRQSAVGEEAFAAARAAGPDATEVLVGLAKMLPSALKGEALRRALAALRTLPEGDEWRARYLSELIPYVPEPLRAEVRQEALDASLAVPEEEHEAPSSGGMVWQQARTRALIDLAPHLTTQELPRALAAAGEMRPQLDRHQALAAFAPRLGELGRADEALSTVRAMTADADELASALVGLVRHLTDEKSLAQATDLAQAMTHEGLRGRALAAVASRWAEIGQCERGLAIARSIRSGWFRLEALSAVAVAVAGPVERELLDAVISAAKTPAAQRVLESSYELEEQAPVRLALRLVADGRIDEALALTRLLPARTREGAVGSRAETLALLARGLRDQTRQQALGEALQLSQVIGDQLSRAWALAKLLHHVAEEPTGRYRPLAAAAVAAIGDLPDEHLLVALAWLPSHCIPALREQLLPLVRRLEEPASRLEGLAEITRNLREPGKNELLEEAVDLARTVAWNPRNARGFVTLVPQLSEPLQRSVVTLAAERGQGWLLGAVGPQLLEPCRVEALAAARRLEDPEDRASALEQFAPWLSEDAQREVLAAVREGEDEYLRAAVVTALAPFATESLLPGLIQAIQKSPDVYTWAEAVAGLAPRLAELGHVEDALAAAGEIPWGQTEGRGEARILRAEALAAVLPRLSESERSAAVHDALTTLTTVEDPLARAIAPATLAPYVPPSSNEKSLKIALDAVPAISDPEDRAKALMRQAPHLPVTLLPQAFAIAVRLPAGPYLYQSTRAAALDALTPRMDGLPVTALHRHLRDSLEILAGGTRSDLLWDLPALSPLIAALRVSAGVAADALIDVTSQWP